MYVLALLVFWGCRGILLVISVSILFSLEGHTRAKWPIFLLFMHVLPLAKHYPTSWSVPPYLYFTILLFLILCVIIVYAGAQIVSSYLVLASSVSASFRDDIIVKCFPSFSKAFHVYLRCNPNIKWPVHMVTSNSWSYSHSFHNCWNLFRNVWADSLASCRYLSSCRKTLQKL